MIKNLLRTTFIFLWFTTSLYGQNERFLGTWEGKLAVSGTELRIVFHITNEDGELIATMDSPDQGAYGIAVSEVSIEGDDLTLGMPNIRGEYKGALAEEKKIDGTWSQGGGSFPLALNYSENKEEMKRPQEPKEPFPYKVENVEIQSVEGVKLSGTITIPEGEGPFPGVILVSGSGPQDRDELVFGHKPFFVIADHLTKSGIAVLRYDDRGVGESTGEFGTATTVDFANDAEAVLLKLRSYENIDPTATGIIGHSEGGLIAPMVAKGMKEVGFIVMLAGPGIPGLDIILLQSRLIARAGGALESNIDKNIAFSKGAYEIIIRETDAEKTTQLLSDWIDKNIEYLNSQYGTNTEETKATVLQSFENANSPWFRFFLSYDPVKSLEKVKCPVLALNGERDLQVPPKENLEVIEKVLKENGNKNYRVLEMEGLNHLFQHSDTGAPSEYANIEETFSEDALKLISDWILALK